MVEMLEASAIRYFFRRNTLRCLIEVVLNFRKMEIWGQRKFPRSIFFQVLQCTVGSSDLFLVMIAHQPCFGVSR
ncbi:hypothetical protein BW685_22135 [Burkholderia ubonensis]|uniref:Uncharacterized protein n=1 Tax=Burkholderia ubonensis TaxID=101571 RepID=A0A1R1J751_9BURK|nr:hypothetical protein BW685_22135 [Burkholderia ubonensis]